MKTLFDNASISTQKVGQACDMVYKDFYICATTGKPRNSKNISLADFNEALNEEVQTYVTVVYIKDNKHNDHNIIDMGKGMGSGLWENHLERKK